MVYMIETENIENYYKGKIEHINDWVIDSNSLNNIVSTGTDYYSNKGELYYRKITTNGMVMFETLVAKFVTRAEIYSDYSGNIIIYYLKANSKGFIKYNNSGNEIYHISDLHEGIIRHYLDKTGNIHMFTSTIQKNTSYHLREYVKIDINGNISRTEINIGDHSLGRVFGGRMKTMVSLDNNYIILVAHPSGLILDSNGREISKLRQDKIKYTLFDAQTSNIISVNEIQIAENSQSIYQNKSLRRHNYQYSGQEQTTIQLEVFEDQSDAVVLVAADNTDTIYQVRINTNGEIVKTVDNVSRISISDSIYYDKPFPIKLYLSNYDRPETYLFGISPSGNIYKKGY